MRILITEPVDFSEVAIQRLEKIGTVDKGPVTKEELEERISEYDLLFVRLQYILDKELLSKATNLKYILTATTGLNHVDQEYCKAHNIQIFCLKGEDGFLGTIPSTAEHTWALLMSLIRKIPASFDSVKQGNWNRNLFKSHNLNALTIGLYGYGRVGKQVAKMAKAFNMNVLAYDLNSNQYDEQVQVVSSKEELFAQSHIISVHINYELENHHLINKSLLDNISHSIYLINTSRGELINENDFLEKLEEGHIKGAAVDVIDGELTKEKREASPLLQYSMKSDNLIITPHIAGATYESMWLTENFVTNKFLSKITG